MSKETEIIQQYIDSIAIQYGRMSIWLSQEERKALRSAIAEQVNLACCIAGFGLEADETEHMS